MDILVEHELLLEDPKQLFTAAYAKQELVLSSLHSLATLGEDEPVMQLSIQVKSKSLQDLTQELPHASAVMRQISLFPPHQTTTILPTAVLIKSVENTYPFTLEWHLSGADEPFIQSPKVKKSTWLSSLFGYGSSKQEATRERFWNGTTKFPTLNGDRHNQLELLGFHAHDFRATTLCIKLDEKHSYYYVNTSYKYFRALQHAFIHVHAKRKELRLWLQQSNTLWKVDAAAMDEVLLWIETECVTDAESCLLSTDKFQVTLQKYDGEGWHVLSEGSKQDTPMDKELCAEIQVLLVYKPASADVGVRRMSRVSPPPPQK